MIRSTNRNMALDAFFLRSASLTNARVNAENENWIIPVEA